MQVTRAAVTDAAELERAVDAFAQQSNAALIVLPNTVTVLHRDLIIALAARHRLPAVYPYRAWARRRAVKQASLLHLLTSGPGTKRTCQSCRSMSAFGGKADKVQAGREVCF